MTARSLHLGIDRLDLASFRGWAGRLRGAENDARAMEALARARGFATRTLLTAAATRAAVLAAVADLATASRADDLVLISFAGHGASFTDLSLSGSEPDGRDEAWCLHDGYLLDDEIHAELVRFPAGVRVLVVADSCFSGTVTRIDPGLGFIAALVSPPRDGSPPGDRRMPPDLAGDVYALRRGEYERRKLAVSNVRERDPAAGVVLLAACPEGETTGETGEHGQFTAALLAAWDGGRFDGDHHTFLATIGEHVPPGPRPVLNATGAAAAAFAAQRPFTP